ncbi:hypothetical protein GCM10010082_27780 [Kushneria pakistanensis]|uniref:Uncharacterized protein n=1 Tax=Kushneria pakistanensis TaxID=1508770 RepID=A0ABQ3FP94_9GAMM|nr:hypothetical protein GCM10010082_27780 [Kushneria pakistanensis]
MSGTNGLRAAWCSHSMVAHSNIAPGAMGCKPFIGLIAPAGFAINEDTDASTHNMAIDGRLAAALDTLVDIVSERR